MGGVSLERAKSARKGLGMLIGGGLWGVRGCVLGECSGACLSSERRKRGRVLRAI